MIVLSRLFEPEGAHKGKGIRQAPESRQALPLSMRQLLILDWLRLGWWDDAEKRFIHQSKTISPEDSLTWEEAGKMYMEARLNYARNGFIDAFAPDYSGPAAHTHQRIPVE